MPYIAASTKPLLWAVQQTGFTIETGITHAGELTVTGDDKSFIYSDEENYFLEQMLGEGAGYNPLPDSGWLEAGEMYSWEDDIVIVRQSHSRTIYPPSDTPALFMFYQAGAGVLDWIAGEQVYVGTHRVYDDVEYVCLQQHVTQSDWTPPAVPALWQLYQEPSQDWQAGVAYTIGQRVTYLGIWYTCRQSHTSQVGWEPPSVLALWLPD